MFTGQMPTSPVQQQQQAMNQQSMDPRMAQMQQTQSGQINAQLMGQQQGMPSTMDPLNAQPQVPPGVMNMQGQVPGQAPMNPQMASQNRYPGQPANRMMGSSSTVHYAYTVLMILFL